MAQIKKPVSNPFHWKRLLQNFLQGLVIIAPVAVTVYAVLLVFNSVDNILPNIIHSLFPNAIGVNSDGSLKRIPGLGFVVVIVLVILIGKISSSFLISKIVDALDHILERTPGIKFIYTAVKEFLEAFAGNKKKFDKPVLVNVDAPDVWRIGFITQEDALSFGLADFVIVYVPLSYAITGVTYFVPKKNIKPIENISSADAMKFAVSGGVTELE